MTPAMGRRPWHEHYDPQVPLELEYPPGPLFEFLDQAARRVPKRAAVVFQNTTVTYERLLRLAETMAANLRASGIGPGDRVALMLPNLPQTVVAYWAVLKAGAVGVMVNPLYKEKELLHQVSDAGCAAMVLPGHALAAHRAPAGLPARAHVHRHGASPTACPSPWTSSTGSRPCATRGRPRVPFDGRRVRRFRSMLRGRERLSHPPADPAPRPGPAPVHRRHHGRGQGRHAQPRQPAGQRPPVAGPCSTPSARSTRSCSGCCPSSTSTA